MVIHEILQLFQGCFVKFCNFSKDNFAAKKILIEDYLFYEDFVIKLSYPTPISSYGVQGGLVPLPRSRASSTCGVWGKAPILFGLVLSTEFQLVISVYRLFFRCLEELFCSLGEGTGKSTVTSLTENEVTVRGCGSLAVGLEGVLALCLKGRVVAEHIPVAAVNSLLHFCLTVLHAALDGVHLTGCIADDE